jgi:hypothetical protein
MIIVIYDPQAGAVVPDAKVSSFVNDIIMHRPGGDDWRTRCQYFTIGSETIINEFRLRVAEGKLPHDELIFEFLGKPFQMNEYAVIKDWPEGFCDYCDKQTVGIVQASMQKRLANPANKS